MALLILARPETLKPVLSRAVTPFLPLPKGSLQTPSFQGAGGRWKEGPTGQGAATGREVCYFTERPDHAGRAALRRSLGPP